MSRGAWLGGGLGLLSILGALYVIGAESKQQAQEIKPAMNAGYQGSDIANIVALNMARQAYFQAKEKTPEKGEDLVPEFIAAIPNEAFSKSNAVVRKYDGSGGWVMDEDRGFLPNVAPQAEGQGKQ
jgi:hypothetical protein